ncbi:transmembrane protein, putative (macronuclear) [Tetrahymena thermophila SB210]|uniref:Transmembrane protein, putative n=1 Tax=Tetrahymena thermophila (strain SB210) TaxID=312017 RepID=Q23B04_TETTS|nr:transmembrane protein, putative [Tetrahymena thermophila SB210]EAR93680.1 transmembrane protein, putative [Tetrahymena thermophila SB210]|eukprot:XP_001013925.1 transmembrane protein, putative [Tetrahymena thermophila SB210]
MKRIIIFALALSIVCCSISFTSATYNTVKKTINILLDDQFKALMYIDTIGEIKIQFDITTQITYFTSPECSNCKLYANENEITPYKCLSQNNCVKVREFDGLYLDGNYILSGDIIAIPMILDGTIFYLEEVYHIKQIVPLLQNPQAYLSQKIGLLLKSDSGDFKKKTISNIYTSLFGQGKIDIITYSLYYADSNYHLTIPEYDSKLQYKPFYDVVTGYHQLYETKTYLTSSVNLNFSDQQIVDSVTLYIDPTFEDSMFVFNESIFEGFKKVINEKRLQPDLSFFTPNYPSGEWSDLVEEFNFGLGIKTSPFGTDIPQPQFLFIEYSADEFMEHKENYYTLKVLFETFVSGLKLGKRIFKKFLYYVHEDTNGKYIYSLTPLKPQKAFRSGIQN